MGQELRVSWRCRGERCGVIARWADGEAHPEPKGWRDGICKACVKKGERMTATDPVDEFNGRPLKIAPKRPKTGGRKKKPEPPALTTEQRERCAALMRQGANNNAVVAAIGGTYDQISAMRRELGIAHPNVVRSELTSAAAA